MNLYPHEVIEYMIASSFILISLIISGFIYWRKRRKIGFLISILITVGITAFFIIRPLWIDNQIQEKTIALEEYLQTKYPNADWTITPVDHRENKTLNHYYLLVDFKDDPHHTYYYYVYKDGTVEQMGGESDEYFQYEEKYREP